MQSDLVDGDSRSLRNAGTYLPNYVITSHKTVMYIFAGIRIPNLIGFIYLSLVHIAEVRNFYSASDQIKEGEMGGTYSMYGEADTCIQHFSQITWMEETV
jgi:hypothetical protein